LATQPHTPTILRIQETVSGTAMLEMSYPCPYTGNTTIKSIWTCSNCSRSDERGLGYIEEEWVKPGRFLEVRGLKAGVQYQVKLKASVDNCEQMDQNSQFNGLGATCSETSEEMSYWVECQYRCADGSCINRKDDVRCNWIKECVDGSDEWNCTCSGFTCDNGFCIQESQRCDGRVNCNDASDETGCPGCNRKQFRCGSGECIPDSAACNQKLDCLDGSDELQCRYRAHICRMDEFKCYSGRCIHQNKRCNRHPDCEQGEDEQSCEFQCGLNEFTCQDGTCIKLGGLCDGSYNCPDASDEMENCHCFKIKEFACRDGSCINRQKVCDGQFDCKDKTDEAVCHNRHTHRVRQGSTTEISPSTVPRYVPDSDGGYPDYFSLVKQHNITNRDRLPGFISSVSIPSNPPASLSQVTEQPGRRRQLNSNSTANSVSTTEDMTSTAVIKDVTEHYLRNVSVRIYPSSLEVREGEDVVFQCRDEGLLRAEVRWSRPGILELPAAATQDRGRLEIHAATRQHAGLYSCQAIGFNQINGGQSLASLTIIR